MPSMHELLEEEYHFPRTAGPVLKRTEQGVKQESSGGAEWLSRWIWLCFKISREDDVDQKTFITVTCMRQRSETASETHC